MSEDLKIVIQKYMEVEQMKDIARDLYCLFDCPKRKKGFDLSAMSFLAHRVEDNVKRCMSGGKFRDEFRNLFKKLHYEFFQIDYFLNNKEDVDQVKEWTWAAKETCSGIATELEELYGGVS